MNIQIKTHLIEFYIRENKLSKAAFCRECGISRQTLNKILENKNNIDIASLFKIAKAINIRISELLKE